MKLLILTFGLHLLIACSGRNTTLKIDADVSSLKKIPHDTLAVLGENIMAIFQDSKENYWFGSWQDGLYRYDGKTILHFTTKSGLPNNRVEDIQEDDLGNMYFNTSSGICKFDGQGFEKLNPVESNDWKLQSGDLWFKSLQFDGRLCRYDGKDLHELVLPTSVLGEEWRSEHPTYSNPYAIYTIYTDKEGNIWFGTAALGVCRYNGNSFDWISENDVNELHNGPANGVRSIIEDEDGYFWFNSAFRYDVYGPIEKTNQTFYHREQSVGNLDGLPDSAFCEYMSIARDNEDNLWMATYGAGVLRYDGTKILHYPVQVGGTDISLFYIYKDKKGALWLGTHENGAFKFNGKTFEQFSL